MRDKLLLLPQPQSLSFSQATLNLPEDGLILMAGPASDLLATAVFLQGRLQKLTNGVWEMTAATTLPTLITLQLTPHLENVHSPQGYDLVIADSHIIAEATTPAGLFYAVQTLCQIIQQCERNLPCLQIQDWPDFPNRGVMLDISRDKVPTMATLYGLVELFASWKLNQLQLYTEHTFAYRQHPLVWAKASPITGDEILRLDAYCRERFIELVPNQNSFGHMHRWLVHPQYNHLAECPAGCQTDWGWSDRPFSLSPVVDDSLPFLHGLYDELLPHFSSRQFNVGCDETVDLGNGRSVQLVAEKGRGRVYLDFLQQIYVAVKERGRTMQFWADIILKYPELLPEIPRDIIANIWGYEADHPFATECATMAATGIDFYVCPGTSSWNAVAGRTDNALANLRNAARQGKKYGALGYLNTDWGDNGHWQPLPASYLGFAYGAGLSWAVDTNEAMDITAVLDQFAFPNGTKGLGKIAYELGNVHQQTGISQFNGTILFWILQQSRQQIIATLTTNQQDQDPVQKLMATRETIATIMAGWPADPLPDPETNLLQREFSWMASLLHHACDRALWLLADQAGSPNASLRQQLQAEADDLIETHQSIWLARNRIGGYAESRSRLEKMAAAYSEADENEDLLHV